MRPTCALAALLLVVAARPALASPEETTRRLECAHVDPRDPAIETVLLRQLGGDVVRRAGPHVLLVRAGGKELRLEDKPPHDEPFAGVHRWFCDRRGGFVLLRTEDGSVSTGTLVNEATGAVTPGGEAVVFSGDGRAYFAQEQPDGLDGMQWKIHFVDGRLSWSGLSFMAERGHPDRNVAYLEDPRWTSTGEFVAQASCIGAIDTRWPVTLRKIDGHWEWMPRATCPARR